ncbi:hypothetical protein MtrunA17_Chr7g0217071 [Medicago truncatula]|uniref:Uncharacterized protein n=1 Tax=Medicago truncatula TaxID=3880 RepID=G7KZX3_MEDTR|nr:hypothetical protein MTR_7g009990 [Medicago truncatula]RHN44226.1 hypothetical protein MtrunA17_Chr7g0217071 [Medicago truncatula]
MSCCTEISLERILDGVGSMAKLCDTHFIVGREKGLRFKYANATKATRIICQVKPSYYSEVGDVGLILHITSKTNILYDIMIRLIDGATHVSRHLEIKVLCEHRKKCKSIIYEGYMYFSYASFFEREMTTIFPFLCSSVYGECAGPKEESIYST